MNRRYWMTLGMLLMVVAFVVAFSLISVSMWEGQKVDAKTLIELQYNQEMSLKEFADANKLPDKVVMRVFHLKNPKQLEQSLKNFPVTKEELLKEVNETYAIYAESLSKNWMKIGLKFILWFLFLSFMYYLIRKDKVSAKNRKWIYLISLVVFGVILGSDPSPMGTVKDAVTMYAIHHVLFIPRFVALLVFLLMVVVFNKFICAWGCQLGALQDFIFRLNRNKKDTKGLIRQYKIPFAVSNGIRIGFFILFILIAFAWTFDIVEYIDPFKIFYPQVVSIVGWIFIGLILVASVFVYRPWCHFFCPFGLVGWLFERFSFVKIKVNYSKCIDCDACSKACPSTVMNTILKQDKVIPDCFSCATCINVCPTDAITFAGGKREKVPVGKFQKENN